MATNMEPSKETPSQDTENQKKGGVLETLRFIVISLVLVFGIRYFIAQPFIVSGESMVPTFENGEYLIVDELSYRFEQPSRGDVIIMRYPLDTKKYFIKRIIGLPGETLSFEGTKITVTPANGENPIVLSEPYLQNEKNDYIDVTLSDHEYYVLGDNRPASSDSRRWGPLPEGDIIGRPLVRLFPLNRISWLPGEARYTTQTQSATATTQ